MRRICNSDVGKKLWVMNISDSDDFTRPIKSVVVNMSVTGMFGYSANVLTVDDELACKYVVLSKKEVDCINSRVVRIGESVIRKLKEDDNFNTSVTSVYTIGSDSKGIIRECVLVSCGNGKATAVGCPVMPQISPGQLSVGLSRLARSGFKFVGFARVSRDVVDVRSSSVGIGLRKFSRDMPDMVVVDVGKRKLSAYGILNGKDLTAFYETRIRIMEGR